MIGEEQAAAAAARRVEAKLKRAFGRRPSPGEALLLRAAARHQASADGLTRLLDTLEDLFPVAERIALLGRREAEQVRAKALLEQLGIVDREVQPRPAAGGLAAWHESGDVVVRGRRK